MKITVLLPVYNDDKYLKYAVASVLNQTYNNFQLLVIDDGSDSGVNIPNILKKFNDNRIHYVKKEHTGLSDTLNFGLKLSECEWIARMDSDEIWHPQKLEMQLSNASLNYSDIYFTYSAYFSGEKILFLEMAPSSEEEFRKKMLLHCVVPHASVIYNKNFILENKAYNEELSVFEDYELWLRIRNKASFILTPEFLLYKRYHPDSLSNVNRFIQKNIIYTFQQPLYDRLSEDFNFCDKNELLEIKGWREYFYGEREKALKYWSKLPLNRKVGKLLVASILLRVPDKYFKSLIRLNISLWLNKIRFLRKNRKIQKMLSELNRISRTSVKMV